MLMPEAQSVDAYLRHAYQIPAVFPPLPLQDEPFVDKWQTAEGREVPTFLADAFALPAFGFAWRREDALRISFAQTMGGRLPVIATGCHEDFCSMDALLNRRGEARELPPTVNAFTMQTRAGNIFRHRLLLLNFAPYSGVAAENLGLAAGEWLELSHRLRLRHECAHYETLRLLSGMRNHALDEILADALGQIAAFGSFSADRQRMFFGIERGGSGCHGRLSFYCRTLPPKERERVYRAVDMVLEPVEQLLHTLSGQPAAEMRIFKALAGTSIADWMEDAGSHAEAVNITK